MLYHITSEKRLPKILKEGLSRFETPLSTEYFKEIEEEEEEVYDCNRIAQDYLNEMLGRYGCVFFCLSLKKALTVKLGLPYKLVILEVNPKKIPCECKVGDAEIADDIYYEYYHSCIHEIPVDYEKIEKLVEEWEKTVETYDPDKKYPDHYEVWCPCDIPPEAIERVYDEYGREIWRREQTKEQILETLKEKIKNYEWFWHIERSIRHHTYFREKREEICKLINCKEIVERIGYILFFGDEIELLRVPSFMEFDSEGTGFKLFYTDPHTKAKWYIKEKT